MEILESILGYLLHTFLSLTTHALRHLRLEEGERDAIEHVVQLQTSTATSDAVAHVPPGNIFPCGKAEMRDAWRHSDLAKSIAPSLGLSLEANKEEDEVGHAVLSATDDAVAVLQQQIHEVRRIRSPLRSKDRAAPPPPFTPYPPRLEHAAFLPAFSHDIGGSQSHVHSGHVAAAAASPTILRFASHFPSPAPDSLASKARDHASSAAPSPMIGGLPAEIRLDLMGHIEAYFASWHTIYPFLDKTTLLKWCSDCEAMSHSKARTALILGVCAASHCHYSATKRGDNETHTHHQTSIIDECIANARRFLLEEQDEEEEKGLDEMMQTAEGDRMEAVQAWILLCLVDFVRNRRARSWMQLGTAVRLAQHIGLDAEDTHSGGHEERPRNAVVQRSRLTWWTLVILDNLLSRSAGRPALDPCSSNVPWPDADDAEEWSTCTARSPDGSAKTVKSHSISVFRALLKLVQAVSTSETSGNGGQTARLSHLQSWVQHLPRHVAPALSLHAGSAADGDPQPQPIHLYHLAAIYHCMHILVQHGAMSTLR